VNVIRVVINLTENKLYVYIKMTQLIKQSWTNYPNIFFSGMPLLTYQLQVEVRRKHVQVLLLWNKRKSDSTDHFFRNACTKSGSLRFSQFSGSC
jgi:hypothetical protein